MSIQVLSQLLSGQAVIVVESIRYLDIGWVDQELKVVPARASMSALQGIAGLSITLGSVGAHAVLVDCAFSYGFGNPATPWLRQMPRLLAQCVADPQVIRG